MTENHKPVDWAEQQHRHKLIQHRKFMWRDDTIDMLAKWLGLKHGMTTVDVGCGLGYLGYTFWPYFGKGGNYTGVDVSTDLLEDALKASEEWSKGGIATFLKADAGDLPLDDDSADVVMCQMLLMHLTKPDEALAEMVRVTRPGGTVLCIETDILSSLLRRVSTSLPELSIDELMLTYKVALYCNRGKKALGRGDDSTGVKVTHMMYQLGLTEIDTRLGDAAWTLIPPYQGPVQKHRLERFKNDYLDEDYRAHLDGMAREAFLAGGGDQAEFDRYLAINMRLIPVMKEQIEKGTFFICGSSDYYIVRGRKPV